MLRVLDMRRIDFDEKWAAYLAYAVALSGQGKRALTDALSLYDELSPAAVSNYMVHSKVYAELLMELGYYQKAHDYLGENPALRELEDDYLWIDVLNPYVEGAIGSRDDWWRLFQGRFTKRNLAGPILSSDGNGDSDSDVVPFDQLDSPALTPITSGPLVSVVMTSFRPDRALRTAVASILNQTWHNIELLIIDDSSPPEFQPLLRELESIDERIQVINLPENVGTYAARNVGLREAGGTFITGSDSDDWSHPQRIELQLAPMLKHPDITSTASRAFPVSEKLQNFRVGHRPSKVNVSSLMIRRSVLDVVGEYDRSRKAADSEYMERVGRASVPTHLVEEPLALIRIKDGSLSRNDFGPFWRHESRRSYVSAYRWWHRNYDMATQGFMPKEARPFPLPASYYVKRQPTGTYDVIFASEWRRYGGPQKSMIEEIKALTSAGYRVAICQMYAARFISVSDGVHCQPIQEMLNSGEVGEVYLDDELTAKLLVVRYPPVLQFLPDAPTQWNVQRLIVLANQAPSERDGSDTRYSVENCHSNAKSFFGREPLWVPQGPTVRSAISADVPEGHLASFDMPGILAQDEWWTERVSFRSTRPVIGRHSRDDPMKWPQSRAVLDSVYPADSEFDVRVMGGARSLSKGFADWKSPANWLIFPRDYMSVRTFLNSIDFFVYFQNENAYDAFGRSTLEALASGCVAILPHHLEPTFGPAGVYCDPFEVPDVVRRFYSDLDAYVAHSVQAVEYIQQKFSHSSYVHLVERLLALE
ncbi:glycosyltransferase [Pseudactinotalea sp. Z1748]|uniref:glycosyltransferase n=1 Tax=Pseudactinotalea sp. Z1748 TaxID=3413027 RepID=UPI003C7B58D7